MAHRSLGGIASVGVGMLRIVKGTTLGGSPSFAPQTSAFGTTADGGVTITSGASVSSRDTAGTTLTNGIPIFAMPVGAGGFTLDMTPFDIFVLPGEVLTIAMGSSSSATCSVATSWNEDQ